MYMIPPVFLCKNHLLGEHNELHKHLPAMAKGYSIAGRVLPNDIQIEPSSMFLRHEELAEEIAIRWPRNNPHKSPFNYDMWIRAKDNYSIEEWYVMVDRDKSFSLLKARCPYCRERILNVSSSCICR